MSLIAAPATHPAPPVTADTPTPRDFRQEVTDSIVKLLEEGTAPWQKPWNAGNALALPLNPTSGKAYRGGNAIHLLAVGMKKGYADPRWMTYKQASEKGWQVQKGEKGTQIEFWDVKLASGDKSDKPDTTPDEGTDDKRDARLIHRVYTVFNAEQIAGLPPHQVKVHTPFEAIEAGEKILLHSGAAIHHDQVDRAFYQRGSDSIHLPRRDFFQDAPGYYGTALHELAHWTGHPSRLDRATLTASYRFGDTNYAREELRAELASLFLAAERGIPHQPDRHAAYVGSWVRALQNDKNEIFRAAQDASKATDYLFALERGEDVTQDKTQNATNDPSRPASHVARLNRQARSGPARG